MHPGIIERRNRRVALGASGTVSAAPQSLPSIVKAGLTAPRQNFVAPSVPSTKTPRGRSWRFAANRHKVSGYQRHGDARRRARRRAAGGNLMDARKIAGKLVIATHNPGKLWELRQLLEPHGVEAVSAGELGLEEPEETEQTFAGNALLKARAAAMASGLPAFADDSGLCVDALDGAPGVYSARWAGEDRDFKAACPASSASSRRAAPRRPIARILPARSPSSGPTGMSSSSRAGSTAFWSFRPRARRASAMIRSSARRARQDLRRDDVGGKTCAARRRLAGAVASRPRLSGAGEGVSRLRHPGSGA